MVRTLSALMVAGVLVSVGAHAAEAQAERALRIGIAGGWSRDAQQRFNGKEQGWHGQIALERGGPLLGIRAEVSYNRFGNDEYVFFCPGLGACTNVKERNEVIGAGLAATATIFGGSVRPYLVGGAGVYRFTHTEENIPICQGVCPAIALPPEIRSDRSTNFGLSGGVGLLYDAAPVGVFLEARYHHLFGVGKDHGIVPVSLGLRI